MPERDPVPAPRAIPRIVIAAVASGVGKTTIAAGIIAALRRRGMVVQPFKCGPDYIDPSYHERAAGRPCRNLDAWMLNDEQLVQGFSRACRDADIAVIEGVMGLFDGSNWDDDRCSTAQIAKLLDAPVLLVIDIAGAARSAATAVLGCQHLDPQLALRGVVLNFSGSHRHAQGCADAIRGITGLPMLGWLPRNATWQIPERHLGLVPGGEHRDSHALIEGVATAMAERFDLGALMEVARTAPELRDTGPTAPAVRGEPAARRPIVAVARDDAFCFYYPENLELLMEAGADIEFFSPLRGETPGADAAGIYLGGGYPELHAAALAANVGFRRALETLHRRNAPIYAECGGFMVLTHALIDADGARWSMAGLIPGVARMTGKLAALGYRHATAARSHLLADGGEVLRGHEFRYSTWECDPPIGDDRAAWQVRGTRAPAPFDSAGFASGNLLASYLHIHFGQCAALARRFVTALRAQEGVRKG